MKPWSGPSIQVATETYGRIEWRRWVGFDEDLDVPVPPIYNYPGLDWTPGLSVEWRRKKGEER